MKGPGSGGAAGQGHVRYRAFAQVATGCVTPKKTPQASETRDVRTTAELNLPFNSSWAGPHKLRTDPMPGSGRQLQDDPAVFSAPVKLNPAHRIQQPRWKSVSIAKLLQNGGWVGKPFVGLERAKGLQTRPCIMERGVSAFRTRQLQKASARSQRAPCGRVPEFGSSTRACPCPVFHRSQPAGCNRNLAVSV